jgi:hypothetical protein
MSSLQAVGAPPEVIERSALGLWIADDAISWMLEKPSELARLEAEYDRTHKETQTANE